MNKKLLLGAVLVFGMGATFTSCVDDSESQSVTNIRNAKAEQLKSIAALNSANAEAALILANAEKAAKDAEAAYNQAQAEYQKALAEKAKADAALVNAQTDAAKAQAEQAAKEAAINLQQLELQLQQQQAELERTLASIEAAIAQSKYSALHYQQMYDELLKNAEAAEAQKLQDLIDAYDTASKNLISAKRTLAQDQMNLIRLQNNLVSAKESIQEQIAGFEEDNADYQIEIDGYQAIVDTYAEYAGKEVTKDDVQAAHVAYVEAQEASKAANETRTEAYNAYNEANNELNNSDYVNDIRNNFLNSGNYYNVSVGTDLRENYRVTFEEKGNDSSISKEYRNKINMVISQWCNKNGSWGYWPVQYIPVFEKNSSEYTEVKYDLSYGNATTGYYTYTTFYNLIDNGKALETLVSMMEDRNNYYSNPEYISYLKEQLTEAQKVQTEAQTAFNTADKAYADAQTAEKAANTKLEEAQAAEADALKAYNAAEELANKEGATEAQIKDAADKLKAYQAANEATGKAATAYNEANNKKWEAYSTQRNTYNALKEANLNVVHFTEQLNNAEYNADYYAEQTANMKELVAKVIAEAATNEANIKAYNEASKAYAEAIVANNIANDNNNVASNEYNTLNNAYNSYTGMTGGNSNANYKIKEAKDQIDYYNGLIESNNNRIAELKKDLAKLDTDDAFVNGQYYEQAVKNLQAQIEKDQVAVETAQKKFDIAEAELNAAVKSEE